MSPPTTPHRDQPCPSLIFDHSSSPLSSSTAMPDLSSSSLDTLFTPLDPSNVPSYLLPWLDSTLQPPYTPIHSPKPVFAYKTVDFDLTCLWDLEDDDQGPRSQAKQQERKEKPKKPPSSQLQPQPQRLHTHTQPQPQWQPSTCSTKRRREASDEQPNNPDGAISKRQRLDYCHPHITVHIPSVASSTEVTTFDPSLVSFYPSSRHLDVLCDAADWNSPFWQSDLSFA